MCRYICYEHWLRSIHSMSHKLLFKKKKKCDEMILKINMLSLQIALIAIVIDAFWKYKINNTTHFECTWHSSNWYPPNARVDLIPVYDSCLLHSRPPTMVKSAGFTNRKPQLIAISEQTTNFLVLGRALLHVDVTIVVTCLRHYVWRKPDFTIAMRVLFID